MNIVDEDLWGVVGLPVEALVAIVVAHEECSEREAASNKRRRRAGNKKRDRDRALEEIKTWSDAPFRRAFCICREDFIGGDEGELTGRCGRGSSEMNLRATMELAQAVNGLRPSARVEVARESAYTAAAKRDTTTAVITASEVALRYLKDPDFIDALLDPGENREDFTAALRKKVRAAVFM